MKIVIVRGPFLNPWEMQNYTPLFKNNEILGITTVSHIFDLKNIGFSVKKLFSLDFFPYLISKKLAGIFNKFTNKIFGLNYYIFGLEKYLKDADFVNTVELYHSFSYQVIRAKKKYGFKVAVTVWENIPFSFERHFIRRKIKKEVKNESDIFIAVTDNIKNCLLLEGIPEEKIKVIYPGVDMEEFKPREKKLELLKYYGLNRDDFIVLFVGRFVWEKGVYDLIYSAKKLISDEDIKIPVKFLFIGSGPEKKKMLKVIKRLNLEKKVIIGKPLSYDRIPYLFNLADIFVLPSIPTRYWQEQFGYVLIEAMASGLPVISTMTGSIPEVVGDAGILVPPNVYNLIYKEVKKLIEDPNLRKTLGKKARERAKNKFSIEKTSKEMKEVFSKLIK